MSKKHWVLITFLVLAKALLPFLLYNPAFELHRDEYLYYEQGGHLSFGYLENPPLIGLLAYISSIFGGSFFWIKFWPVLFGVLTLVVTLRMVKELGGDLFAQSMATLGILFSAYLRIHFLFQPNFLDIFFWSLSAYYLLRFINTPQNKYIFLLAFSLALGWYSKYSILFFVIALLLSFLFTYHRTIFGKRLFWLAFSLALVLILPNILWQYFHNWPLVHHMNELRETQLRNLNRLDFMKEQILMLFPVAFLWIGGLIWLLKNSHYRIIAYCYLLIISLLMMGSGKGYYALGAYPMLLAAGGVWAERISVKRIWLRYVFVISILVLALPFVPLLLPMQTPEAMAVANKEYGIEKMGVLKWEDGENHSLQQDFADMLGWKELAVKTENYYKSLPDSTKRSTLIYCRNYGLAGGMKYYTTNTDFRERIISNNGSFVLWISNRIWFKNLILVGAKTPGSDEEVFQHFKNVQLVDSCNNPFSRQYGNKIIFFQNASDSARLLMQKGLAEMKQQFSR
jgi:hypothetical protein